MELKNDIMKSVLKLMRAMRRRPMHPDREVPPAVGRVLMTLQTKDGASPAELCEVMDVRPSSMSELLGRMEESGYITRTVNEADKRATKVFLNDSGKAVVERIESRFREDYERMTACFSEEELARFCELCDKLSAHLESLPEAENCRPHGCHGPHGPHGPCGPHKHHRGPGMPG